MSRNGHFAVMQTCRALIGLAVCLAVQGEGWLGDDALIVLMPATWAVASLLAGLPFYLVPARCTCGGKAWCKGFFRVWYACEGCGFMDPTPRATIAMSDD
jgi:hypothetical protein